VCEPSAFEGELTTEKPKKSQITWYGSNYSRINNAGSRRIVHQIHKLIIPIWSKEELPEV
jgi:hypothetical protein